MFRKILVPLDGSSFAAAAVATGARLAHQHNAELHLVHVDTLNGADGAPGFLDRDEPARSGHHLKALAATIETRHDIKVVTAALRGAVIDALARHAEHADVDLIVMATHGRTGFSRALAGSFADDLMHVIHVPVILVRVNDDGSTTGEPFRRILVGLDGSTAAERVLATASVVAKGAQATLLLVEVVVPVPIEVNLAVTAGSILTDGEATQRLVDAAQIYLEGVATEIRRREEIDVHAVVDIGLAVSTMSVAGGSIAKLADERHVDLVALTASERRGSRLLLRSVADRVLHDTRCALLLVPGANDGLSE